MRTTGKVWLIGAGPGNFGLLTIRALELIKEADVILYDHLIPFEVFTCVREDCELIDVGKQSGNHSLPQEETNKLLIEKALQGRKVVRLKGGDPFVFGRGGEEAIALNKKGVPFEVVPGVTSGIAVPAFAGIPVTHRNTSVNVHFVTAHEANNKSSSQVKWELLAKDDAGTIVGYMGVKTLPEVTRNLMKAGLSPDTPAALIRYGTRANQLTLIGVVSEIAEKARLSDFKPPALFVIGKVVNLSSQVDWIGQSPLFGKRIVVPRDREGAEEIARALRPLGAEVYPLPVIKIETILPDPGRKDNAYFQKFDWCIFTSSHGVEAFANLLENWQVDIRALQGLKFAAIGKSTAETLRKLYLKVEFVPEKYSSIGFVEEFLQKYPMKGKSVLRIRGNLAPETIETALIEAGATVESLTLYNNRKENPPEPLIKFLNASGFDVITFTSSSTFSNFLDIFGLQDAEKLLEKSRIYSIGPETSGTIRKKGFNVFREAAVHNVNGLIECILKNEINEGSGV